MEALIYVALCLPAVLMILTGVMISTARKDNTMTRHHFANDFNIKKPSKQIIILFTVSGIVFSLGGLLIVKEMLAVGLVLMFVMLVIFIASFFSIHRKG